MRKILMSIMLIFSCLFSICTPVSVVVAEDSQTSYSNVLTDLQKDEEFNVEAFPVVENDYSLKVIQIAESVDKELFVYVYQPTGETKDLVATTINISQTIGENFSPLNYTLKLLNSNGVFYKYLVEDLVLKEDVVRYYEIVSIFRAFNTDIDGANDPDNYISEKSYEVGQLWTACTLDGEVYYNYTFMETILVSNKYVSFVRYTNGSAVLPLAHDAFFVAFSTNKDIETLIEADVTFVHYTYHKTTNLMDLTSLNNVTYEYGEDVTETKTLRYDKAEEVKVGFIFRKVYTWDQIESVSEFMEDKSFSSEAVEKLSDKNWVLNFFDAEYTETCDSVMATKVAEYEDGTRVRDVTILRLKFETNGVVYNLGVVDNKQSSSENPITTVSPDDWWKWLIIIVCCLLALAIFTPYLPFVWSFIVKMFGWLLKGIWWVICLPVTIVKLFKGGGKR